MEIKDNVKGIRYVSDNDHSSQSGNGIHNMKAGAEEINARLKIESSRHYGTVITLTYRLD